jgi:hypothetical protein
MPIQIDSIGHYSPKIRERLVANVLFIYDNFASKSMCHVECQNHSNLLGDAL